MNSWFTPTVLFVLLNLMIGTIFITSSLATHKPSDHHQEQGLGYGHQLARSPSQIYDQIQELDGQLQEQEEEEFQEEDHEQTLEEIYSKLQGNKLSKSTSDTKPASGEVPKKLPKKMKKSASAKSAFSHFEEDDIVESRRPATVQAAVEVAEDELYYEVQRDDW
ncbi:hypothetical protein OIU84_000387 [Salix udensis]|uniref:DUF4408 domain-containing protein n=1 Tax=Salix udensis TaxID=889485 RepID=A0AAD6L4I6_9ROSI|nr:hypothetical protein OIU84_000387 [Salix udensis]